MVGQSPFDTAGSFPTIVNESRLFVVGCSHNSIYIIFPAENEATLGLSWNNVFYWFLVNLERYNLAISTTGRILFQNQTGFYYTKAPSVDEIREALTEEPVSLSDVRTQSISNELIPNQFTILIGTLWNCAHGTTDSTDDFFVLQDSALLIVSIGSDENPTIKDISYLLNNLSDIVDIKSSYLSEMFIKSKVCHFYRITL